MSSIKSTFIPEIIVGKNYQDYMKNIFHTLPILGEDKLSVLDRSLIHAHDEGYWFEFGIHEGETIVYTAGMKLNVPDFKIYGFDSFEGLPEDWLQPETGHPNLKGHFNLDGNIPKHLLSLNTVDIIYQGNAWSEWDFTDLNGNVIISGSHDGAPTSYTKTICIADGCYLFVKDATPHCYGWGWYQIKVNGVLVASSSGGYFCTQTDTVGIGLQVACAIS